MEESLNPKYRKNVRIGQFVSVVEKQNQGTDELTEGVVKALLTNAKFHPHGIKVKLEYGEVGRVQEIIEDV